MIEVKLYGRDNCHLCEDAERILESLQEAVPHRVIHIDIEDDDSLHKAYWDKIPVIEIGPYRIVAPVDPKNLEITLRAAQDRERHIIEAEKSARLARAERNQKVTRTDRFSYWLSKHYLAVFNGFILIYLLLPFLAPVLMRSGADGAARLIYRGYGAVCHQLAFRSFFIFGEQAFYPREAAQIEGVLSYEQAINIDSEDLYAARDFLGNSTVGYKVALCERDVAIYGGLLLFGLIFALTGRRLSVLPWYLWLIIGVLPMGLDGFSQLVSQLPYDALQRLLPYRESTPLLRVITGLLFGVTTAWFGYPNAELAMRDTRKFLESKFIQSPALKESVSQD